jgi:hypothetical protein
MERVLSILNKYLLANKVNEFRVINVPNKYVRIDLNLRHWFKIKLYCQDGEVTMFDMSTDIPFGWNDSYTIEELVDLQNFIRDVRILPNDEGHIVWLYEKVKEAYERLTVEYGTGRI